MLRDEHLMMLTIVYLVCGGSLLKNVRTWDIEHFVSEIKKNESLEMQQVQKILPSEQREISNLLLYLDEERCIKGEWTIGNREVAHGRLKITAKGIDYIEDPYATLSKEYPRTVTASNITNIKANGDVNIIQSTIIQKNIQNFSDTELKELNDKLDELKDVISDASLKETLEEIRGDLESNEKINAAQKLSKFQNFIAKMRDSQTILLTIQLVYNLIRSIFHLP
jgi:hypothetical protein